MQERTEFELKDEWKHLPLRAELHKRIRIAAAKAGVSMNDYLSSVVPKE